MHVFEVSTLGPVPAGGQVMDVVCTLAAGNPATVPQRARGWHASAWNPQAGDDPDCYVRTWPAPKTEPSSGVDPSALVAVRFTEPIDAASAEAYDGLGVALVPSGAGIDGLVAGDVSLASDGTLLKFTPHQPFPHVQGTSETLFMLLSDVLVDLDGISLPEWPASTFRLDKDAATAGGGSIVLDFDAPDEDGNGFPEWRGQVFLDSQEQSISGRPVVRFSRAADSSQLVPSIMIPYPPGVQGPLNPLGARSMSVYRHLDVGLSSTDETLYDLDVERLHWAPVAGQVDMQHFPEFEIALGHGHFLPDEYLNPVSLLPSYPNSGLTANSFAANVLGGTGTQVVHPRALGYDVNPLDKFTGVSGRELMPFPLNTGADPLAYQYFTWRDTSVTELGGPGGTGLETAIAHALGLVPQAGAVAAQGFVPSFGLPLLMDFKCFPDDGISGVNSFDVSIAINSSTRPSFRAYSSGGFNTAGLPVVKDPDLEQVPSGGFNPLSSPPGQSTPPTDNTFFQGQIDFVVRVSRAHSIWFDSGVAAPDWTVVDLDGDFPRGTSVQVEFRGATSVGGSGAVSPAQSPFVLDAYGDQQAGFGIPGDPANKNLDVTFLNGDDGWKSSLDDLDGARYVQARLTFVGNPVTTLIPRLEALGLSYIP
jgi:hypothetical protein